MIIQIWDYILRTTTPTHTDILNKHTHAHTLFPLGEQPLHKPGIPVYQMCQLVIYLPASHWTFRFKEASLFVGEYSKPKLGTECQMVQWNQTSESMQRVCVFKPDTEFLFPWMSGGFCVMMSSLVKKHFSEFNWRVPYRKFKQLKTLLEMSGKRLKWTKWLFRLWDFQELIFHLFSYKQQKRYPFALYFY